MYNEKEFFDTIEHDYMHIKDYFNNYKFGFIERASKQFYLQNLKNSSTFVNEDLLTILNQSKDQLKDVKKVSKEAGILISDFSIKNYELKIMLEKNTLLLKEEERLEEELLVEMKECEEKLKSLEVINDLNNKLNSTCDEIQQLLTKIKEKKEIIKNFNVEILREEIGKLKKRKEELSTKEKRWSKVYLENYLEDLYSWYLEATRFLKKIFFCHIENIESIPDGFKIYLSFSNNSLILSIVKGKFSSAKLLKEFKGQNDSLLGYCIKINDPILFTLKIILENVCNE